MWLDLLLQAEIAVSGYVVFFFCVLCLSAFLYRAYREIEQRYAAESIVYDYVQCSVSFLEAFFADEYECEACYYDYCEYQQKPVCA